MTTVHPVTGLVQGTFGIGTFAAGHRIFPALVRPDGGAVDVSERFHDTHAVFDDWPAAFAVLSRTAADAPSTHHLDDLRPLPPLAHPNVLCAGANYKRHVAEMLTRNRFNQHNRLPGEDDEAFFARNLAMMDTRAREGTPFLWTSLHSALAGAGDDITLPHVGVQHDWELEIGAVIGRTARNASLEEARELIAGYVMVDDLGSVDLFRRTDIPWGYDWIAKHQPGFKPCGPFVVPAPFVDVDRVRITLKVNGATMQDWPASDMVFDLPSLVAYASERVRLLPGDIVTAGSPPGNGAHHGRFLTPGDLVEGEITGLGRQHNRCVTEDTGGRTPVFGAWKNQEDA
ncbi:fumarylacetoacetate hydrolase family protein [Streptomyces sp. SID4956]|uniref:fumarylacetoacetate hydrolase family protein n=1 Tax=Streptomyces sp. SID4956 TaxID=2690290 RepID=UPI00136F02EC|nr:fumarylacetoacetate hydrolase family protein [Streptomyces sp. SID4956]